MPLLPRSNPIGLHIVGGATLDYQPPYTAAYRAHCERLALAGFPIDACLTVAPACRACRPYGYAGRPAYHLRTSLDY